MSVFGFESESKPLALISFLAFVSGILVVAKFIRAAYFGPLSHIPGPKITAISRLPYARHMLNGTIDSCFQHLHDTYGPIVRFSPNEVSFISGETAWQDIYGFRTGKMRGHLNMQKDPVWYSPPPNGSPSILVADDDNHARGRRVLSHAFSAGALGAQEPLIQKYVDQLVDRIAEVTDSTGGDAQDMEKWYTWATFDIINDLTFGEPLGCLQNQTTHDYIKLLANNVDSFRFFYILRYYPWLKRLGSLIIDKNFLVNRYEYFNWVVSQTTKRMERETERPDFVTHILKHNGEKGQALTKGEIDSNAALFLTAGSETTATLLCGVTYLLIRNRAVLRRLQDEIRGRWSNYDDITIDEVNKAPYLLAVLSEALRYFPPVPAGFQRRVGFGGETVSGVYVPEGTAVSMSQLAAYHSPLNFKDPEKFVPERWMGDEHYADDRRAVVQPFSTGPRNCIGKNLAYAEMRLIVAKLVWSFDMEFKKGQSDDWMSRCSIKTLWQKPELMVKFSKVQR